MHQIDTIHVLATIATALPSRRSVCIYYLLNKAVNRYKLEEIQLELRMWRLGGDREMGRAPRGEAMKNAFEDVATLDAEWSS